MKKIKKMGLKKPYSLGPYNVSNDIEQYIRISQGCPNNCPFCYESREETFFGVPEIIRNKVKIMDMNLLSKMKALEVIKELGYKKVGGRVVYYELICGIDWRFLTDEISRALKKSRFVNIRLAWDYYLEDQYKIIDSIKMLLKAGYKPGDITVFMICNWEVPFEVCFKKMYLCSVWNVKVADCYFDGQKMPNVKPVGWSLDEIFKFRSLVRKHNQYVRFGIDPEVKVVKNQIKLFR